MTTNELNTLLQPLDRAIATLGIAALPFSDVIEGEDLVEALQSMRNALIDALSPKRLSMADLRKLGALDPEADTTTALEKLMVERREYYALALRADLEEELLRRDKSAFLQGRQMADQRMAGRLLREVVRGLLHSADKADLQALTGGAPKGQLVSRVLDLLGAEPADHRLLAESGTTLGGGQTPEERAETFDKLASGELDATKDSPVPSPRIGDQVRDFQARVKPKESTRTEGSQRVR